MKEEWRQIAEYEGLYEVSNLGRVKSLPRLTHLGKPVKGITVSVIMKGSLSNGYRHVNLARGGLKRSRSVHALVMAAFIGPCPKGKQVNHKNFNRDDNRLANLEYLTRSEDEQHKRKAGRGPHGETHHAAKLCNDDVLYIRSQYGKQSSPKLAFKFGVTHRVILLIWKRQLWTSL